MVKFKSDSSLKRVMNNGVFMAIRFAVFTLSGVLFIPFLVSQYGKGGYGLIALAGFLTQHVGVLSGSIGNSIARFLNVSLNRQDMKQAGQIFSTSILVNAAIVLIQVPFFALALWKLDYIIDFPPEQSLDFRILVSCNVVVYMIAVMRSSIATPIYAANRMDISYMLDVVWQLLRLVLLVALILHFGPRLWIIGVVDLALSLGFLGVIYSIYQRLARGLAFHWKSISWVWVKPVMGMASWTLVAELGQILFQKTDVWIINRFVDRDLAGVCAALLIWPNFAQQIAKSFSSLLAPAVMIDYAHERFDRIRSIVLLFSGLLVAVSLLGCGITMLAGEWMLDIWMGNDFCQYHIFLVLMLIHFPLTLAREAIWLIFPAYNKMQYLGISNLVGGAMNIGLSLLAVKLGYGLAGVIIATGISLVVQRTFFLTGFACRVLEMPVLRFVKLYVPGFVLIGLVCYQWLTGTEIKMGLNGLLALLLGGVLCVEIVVRDPSGRTALKAVRDAVRRR